jgi:hypothetical protein
MISAARNRPQAFRNRVAQMASHLSTSTNGALKQFNIRDLPKSNNFTSKLPADQQYPTPQSSHNEERRKLGPRLVKNAAFTYVRPETFEKAELVGVSKTALKDLALDPASIQEDDFKETVAGQKIITIDGEPKDGDVYPWAQCYGGTTEGRWQDTILAICRRTSGSAEQHPRVRRERGAQLAQNSDYEGAQSHADT